VAPDSPHSFTTIEKHENKEFNHGELYYKLKVEIKDKQGQAMKTDRPLVVVNLGMITKPQSCFKMNIAETLGGAFGKGVAFGAGNRGLGFGSSLGDPVNITGEFTRNEFLAGETVKCRLTGDFSGLKNPLNTTYTLSLMRTYVGKDAGFAYKQDDCVAVARNSFIPKRGGQLQTIHMAMVIKPHMAPTYRG